MNATVKVVCVVLSLVYAGSFSAVTDAVQQQENVQTGSGQITPGSKAKLEHRRQKMPLEELNLLEDTTRRLSVSELNITGNSLISTAALLGNMPVVYNSSDKPLRRAEQEYLYDFSSLYEVVLDPGQSHQVSARTIQGFTQYVLSAYQRKHYAGIRVYVPEDAISAGRLKDGILTVRVIEATVSNVTVSYYDPNHEKLEQGYLKRSLVLEWSPAKQGQVTNQKKLDEFVNLLNLNPDRYVSPVMSKGTEPNSLALDYDIYEANPWHFYVQVDNSGSQERQWAPRVGFINTNLLGFDDRFTAMCQAPWESGIEDNYMVFGSYDVPVLTPRLRLKLYAGYSEFDVTPEGGAFNFLGRGSFYGGMLSYNLFQTGGWFFDVTGSLGHEESKVTPSLFPTAASNVDMDLLGVGFNMYRSDDLTDTSIGFNRVESIDGSSGTAFDSARSGASPDFRIYTAHVGHGRYLDTEKVHRLSGSFRYIDSSGRLVPAKMTTFGGLYSVRGYKENEIVADGGIVASVQYEFDLVKYDQTSSAEQTEQGKTQSAESAKPRLRKLAPLAFIDFGRAVNKAESGGQHSIDELCSIGLGAIAEVGENFSGAVYYGWPIRSTTETDKGDGRFNISLILRW